MYGIIHNAIRSVVLLHADESVWNDILAKTDLTDQHFLSPANYSDEITFQLIGAVAKTMGLSINEALRVVGEHWCDYTIGAGYGSLFRMAGRNLGDFFSNLDRMHSSLNIALPEASMPYFDLIRSDAKGYEVVYRSEREGLSCFVEGIFRGLFRHFNESIEMSWEIKPDGTHFLLRRLNKNGALVETSGQPKGDPDEAANKAA